MSDANQRVRVVALISGGGRTLRNLVERSRSDSLHFEVVHVVSTRAGARGVEVARELSVPCTAISRRSYESGAEFSAAIVEVLEREAADLVVCGGFLSKLDVPAWMLGKIVNIHPSLLPLFGGKGFFGDRVHQAVLDSGMKVSGCTVHFVNNEYDAGPIIAQRCVPVLPDDTAEALAGRVFAQECELYPSVVNDLAIGRVWLERDEVRFLHESSEDAGEA